MAGGVLRARVGAGVRLTAVAALASLGSAAAPAGEPVAHHALPVSAEGNLVVGLCDGETAIEVPGVKPGDPITREQGQRIADALMAEWQRKHPDLEWQKDVMVADAGPAMSGATGGPPQTQTYGNFTARDQAIWNASTQKLIDEGNRIFHDAKALGGTVGISCDMCHPNASNTHAETYPKYQVQLGRVALLRDMINWCIENPVRGKPFAEDDPRLKALEAYIISQRKGVPLDYGKH
jgi:thiosulfate dehydrogenase